MKKTKQVRLKDIAQEANYSISTVAKVLSGMAKESRISNHTAIKIKEIANRLDYVPNQIARKLRAKKSGLVGIYLSYATDPICSGILTAILQELPRRGFSPILTAEETDFEECRETWIRNRIEGLIFCGPSNIMVKELFAELKDSESPRLQGGAS